LSLSSRQKHRAHNRASCSITSKYRFYIVFFSGTHKLQFTQLPATLFINKIRFLFLWEDNIRMDFQEVGLGYENWIGLAQDRARWRALVNAVRNLRVP